MATATPAPGPPGRPGSRGTAGTTGTPGPRPQATPRADEPATMPAIPTRGRMFLRGLLRRCPICGSGKLFTKYFRLKDHCPRCGLRFQRLEGQWSGDIGINTVVTFGLLYVVMMVGVIAFWGRLNVAVLGALGAFVVVIFPALFVPFAKTLWLAIDLMMRPVEDDEFVPPPAP